MKQKFTYLFLFIMLCHVQGLFAQAEGDYRSIATGDWATTTTWERFTGGSWAAAPSAPTSTDGVITIRNTHTVTVAAAVTIDQVVIESGGILANTSAVTLSDGAGTDLDVQAGGTWNVGAQMELSGVINNAGTVNWSNGAIDFDNCTFNNNSSFNITGNNPIDIVAATTNSFNNALGGTISKTAGTGNTSFNLPFVNAGSINVNTGTFRNIGGATEPVTNSGTINIASGATFNVPFAPVTFDAGTVLTGSGLLRINGTTTINLSLSTPSTLTYECGGQILNTASGTLTINGILNWTANAIRIPLTIATGATVNATGSGNRTYQTTLINNGIFNWDIDGDLVLSTATVTNNSTGTFTWNPAAARQIRAASGTTTFTNNGNFNKTSTFDLTIPSVAFTNSNGATLFGAGTITFSGTGTLTNNGIVSPGPMSGTAATLTLPPSAVSSTSTTVIAIKAAGGPGVGHDQLILTGAVNTDLTGSTLTVTDNPAAPLATYTIMTTSGTFSNTFGTVNIPVGYSNLQINATTITIDKSSMTSLPLTWGTFTAKAVEQRALLTWKTLQEVNTSHFVIERSTDGASYKAIGTVPAQGNSTVTTTYTFTDPSPIQSSYNFYRLLQVDLDGKSERSIVRTLKLDRTKLASLIIQGNPVRNNVLKLNVTADDAISIAISDMSGKVVKAQLLQPGIHDIPVSKLNAGTYQITVMESGKITSIKRFVKL